MAALLAIPAWIVAACLAGALVVTLVLAAWWTPRRWWRRPTAGALAVLAGGTALFAYLFLLTLLAIPHRVATPPPALALVPVLAPLSAPIAPRAYRVFDDLNLRAASNTGAARVAVIGAGATVTTTGRIDGDWWEVKATVKGRPVTGWASSLWLRRGDEHQADDRR